MGRAKKGLEGRREERTIPERASFYLRRLRSPALCGSFQHLLARMQTLHVRTSICAGMHCC